MTHQIKGMDEEKLGSFLVGVSMILIKNNKVFLGKRIKTKDFGGGLWEFPSGRLNQGEEITTGLKREMKEELSIEVEPIQLVDAYSFQRINQEVVLLNYYCTSSEKPQQSNEHDEIGWFEFDDAFSLLNYAAQKNTLRNFIQIREIFSS